MCTVRSPETAAARVRRVPAASSSGSRPGCWRCGGCASLWSLGAVKPRTTWQVIRGLIFMNGIFMTWLSLLFSAGWSNWIVLRKLKYSICFLNFDRCQNRKSSIKQHTEYFNCLCEIQLDHLVTACWHRRHPPVTPRRCKIERRRVGYGDGALLLLLAPSRTWRQWAHSSDARCFYPQKPNHARKAPSTLPVGQRRKRGKTELDCGVSGQDSMNAFLIHAVSGTLCLDFDQIYWHAGYSVVH